MPAYGLNALRAEALADFPVGVADLERMGNSNVGMYRARFRRDKVLASGSYSNWTQLDNLARQASLYGVTLQPVLIDMPGEVYSPPKTSDARAAFARFAEAAVRRYGPNGSFWTRCHCPKRPVRVWEVWNEPNMAPFWDFPSPVEYARLLHSTRAGLRRADPSARILFGGLAYPSSYSATRLEPNEFLRQVIATVGSNNFDALAVHTYKANADYAVNTLIAGTVDTLKAYGGTSTDGSPRHQLWLNEFGRPTTSDDPATPQDEQQLSEAAQRDWQDAILDRLLPQRAAWNVGPVMWYSIRDSQTPTASWHRQGLRRTNADDTDGGAKPSWDAYVARSAGAELLDLPQLVR